jgi:hypothetical protein
MTTTIHKAKWHYIHTVNKSNKNRIWVKKLYSLKDMLHGYKLSHYTVREISRALFIPSN